VAFCEGVKADRSGRSLARSVYGPSRSFGLSGGLIGLFKSFGIVLVPPVSCACVLVYMCWDVAVFGGIRGCGKRGVGVCKWLGFMGLYRLIVDSFWAV